MLIEDGRGEGKSAKVDSNYRLHVSAKSSPVQHIVSEDENAYQVIGEATPASGTVIPLFITNNDTIRNCVLSYIRLQVITDAAALPVVGEYFSIRVAGSWTSGGTAVTPVNMNINSSNTASVTAYKENSLVVGAGSEIDRWYPESNGDKEKYNKEGSLIIPAGGSIEIAYVGTGTAGNVYARASFYMESPD